jgi:DNA polymerase/3'-5' exonuclease PolX
MSYTKNVLDMLMNYKADVKGDKMREMAYSKAINILKNIEIKTMDDVKNIKGIGKGIRDKIEVVLNTTQPVQNRYNFTQIHGIGPAKMKELNDKGVMTLEQLRQNEDLLNKTQKIGLKYIDELVQRIPYEEMAEHDVIINGCIPNGYTADIVGSYRRMKESSGDIDVLLCSDATREPELLENIVKSMGDYIVEILALKTKKFMGICRLNGGVARRIDIMVTPPEEYVYALSYFTGSKEHNVIMRAKARELGYTLNEHRLQKLSDDIPNVPKMKTEKQLFDFLGVEYKEPHDR